MWDKVQQAKAMDEGWKLVTTINNGDTHPLWDVVPHGLKFKSIRAANHAVINAAKNGSTFHQQALKLVAGSRMRARR